MEPLKAISFLLFALSLTDAATEWSYEREAVNGPANWGTVSADCDELSQSPINFVHEDTISVSWEPFEFKGYKRSTGSITRIKNNGHSAMMELDGFHSVSEGGLPTEYEAIQAHFHWGKTDAVGSEHTIDGKQFPLEMHIVHYAYIPFNGSVGEAVGSGDPEALAVLGVLFEIGDEDNEEFAEIIKGLTEITVDGEAYDFLESVSLIDLLPEDKSTFYRYNGSLTTPLCDQIVTWTVFTDTVPISRSQIAQFRALTEGSGSEVHSIGDAFRPVQPVNDRDVFYNGAVLTTIPSLVLVMGLIMIHLIQ